MSKSAIKALTAAQEIIAAAGANVNLVGYVTDSNVRKSWRNADALASLVINSAANAFQCENSETFADNAFDNMAEAVERYIDANLEDWNGKTWTHKDTAAELVRLAGMVARNVAYEQANGVEYPTASAEAFQEAREMNRYVGNADLLPQSGFCQADRDYLLAVNARLHPDLLAFDVSEAHAEALVMNAEIDALAVKLANSRCYWWQPNTIHNVQQNAIAQYKRDAFKEGPRVAQHIVKVIIIAKRIAARMKGIFEERPIDVGMPAYHELPF